MKHYLNVCDINGAEVAPVDVITFGSPCQDLSVAGKRAGIQDGERSNLFFQAVRIIKEMRKATNGEYPKYAVWENVPGALSSNKGRDFCEVLEALCSVCDSSVSIPKPFGKSKADRLVWLGAGTIVGDGYSVAWRTLDAQYWGVPQRRKRIYLVADFTGNRAGEILFNSYSVFWNLPQGNEQGQGTAAHALGSVDGSVGDVGITAFSFDSLSSNSMKSSNPISGCREVDIAKCIDTTYPDPAKNQGGIAVVECLNPWDCQSKRVFMADGIYPTLPAMDCSGRNNQAVIALQGNGIDRADTAGCNGSGWREGECYTLNTIDRPAVCFDRAAFNQGENALYNFEVSEQGIASTVVAKGLSGVCYDARGNGDGETVNTITGDHQNRITDYTAVAVYEPKSALEENWAESTAKNALRANASKSSHAVVQEAYGIGNGQADQTDIHDKIGALNCMHDQQAVLVKSKPPRKYIIRRLTPTECARLQGFYDWWTELAPYDPADAEFWESVRKTYAEINGKKYKPCKNLKKWYEGLHTDSAEYKAYGNGLALPCAENVMRGIAEAMRNEKGQFVSEGGTIEHKGYTCIYKPDHPRAKANGYVREHVLVAEEMLGRTLDDCEVIHHINGDKSDNRPENLMVFPNQAEHIKYHNRLDGTKYNYRNGEYTIAELAEFAAVDYATLTQRINKLKWDTEKAVETPKRGQPTLGSLFDGIGGFPLAGMMNGITPLWSSEIEPYPIAVTISRFPQTEQERTDKVVISKTETTTTAHIRAKFMQIHNTK